MAGASHATNPLFRSSKLVLGVVSSNANVCATSKSTVCSTRSALGFDRKIRLQTISIRHFVFLRGYCSTRVICTLDSLRRYPGSLRLDSRQGPAVTTPRCHCQICTNIQHRSPFYSTSKSFVSRSPFRQLDSTLSPPKPDCNIWGRSLCPW